MGEAVILLGFFDFLCVMIEWKMVDLDMVVLYCWLLGYLFVMMFGGLFKYFVFVEFWWFEVVVFGEFILVFWVGVDFDVDFDWDWYSVV